MVVDEVKLSRLMPRLPDPEPRQPRVKRGEVARIYLRFPYDLHCLALEAGAIFLSSQMPTLSIFMGRFISSILLH